ncbi:MAG TPA: zinc metalloprotease HtpX [Candidatus Acidoferrales bacterium]|nr:zinc metalloprotease HtpX [Candidatus Acidoferrales bacterium]
MGIVELRLSMLATLTIIIGLSTLVLTGIMLYFGVFNIIAVGIIVVAINIAEWLFAPYLLGFIYKIRKISQTESPQLHQIVNNLSQKCHIKTPELMLAQVPVPNAFAYGSPLTGNRVAVTPGLLTALNTDEVEAVLGHELGHLRHKDVQVMMAVSALPSVFMFLAYSFMWSGNSSGGSRRSGGGNGNGAIIGLGLLGFGYLLTFFTLWLSRVREYYADRNSVQVVDNGAWKLSTGLAKIVSASRKPSKSRGQGQQQGASAFRCLFISDPGNSEQAAKSIDASLMVQEILSRKITGKDNVAEALSTHPNITKRLRALQQLSQNPNA